MGWRGVPSKGRALAALALLLAIYPATVAKADKIAGIGFVSWSPATLGNRQVASFREGLRELGYREGENIKISSYFTDGDSTRTHDVIADLVQQREEVLVVFATPAVHIAKEIAQTTPIVFIMADPVATGVVRSLSRPGGNLTGLSSMTPDLAAKRLQLLRELRPSLRSAAFLGSNSDPQTANFVRETRAAAELLNVHLSVHLVDSPAAIDEGTFAAIKRDGAEAVIVQPIFQGHEDQIIHLATKSGLPIVADRPAFAVSGALLTYGFDNLWAFHRAAFYVDKILKGARPADLPIEQPTHFELVINLQTAKSLGWRVPQSLLSRADRVIE